MGDGSSNLPIAGALGAERWERRAKWVCGVQTLTAVVEPVAGGGIE